MSSVLERLNKAEGTIEQLVMQVSNPDPMLQMALNKIVGLEQSMVAMGKTLAAVTEELSETEVLNSTNVMARLRQAEDQSSRDNVKALLDQEVIEPSSAIGPSSLVAIEQKILNTESGETTTIAAYHLIGMKSPQTNQVWVDSLLGKVVGDTVRGVDGTNEQEVLTVLEIYSIKERDVQGETVSDNEPSSEEGEPTVYVPVIVIEDLSDSNEEISFDQPSTGV